MRIGPEQLRDIALLALEDAVQECRYRTPRRSFAIRFALAYLWSTSTCSRGPFDRLWQELRGRKSPWSYGCADQALLVVYRALGVERDDEVAMQLWRRWSAEEGHGGGRD